MSNKSNKEQMLEAMHEFYRAAAKVSEVWDSLETQHEQWYASNEEYPFIQDFGVVVARIGSWIEMTEDNWNFDQLIIHDEHEERMKHAKAIAEYNDIMNMRGVDTGKLIGFNWNDLWIHNPFNSDDYRFDPAEGVDPVAYYGEAFLKSEFYRSVDEIKALHVDIKLPGGITEDTLYDLPDMVTPDNIRGMIESVIDYCMCQAHDSGIPILCNPGAEDLTDEQYTRQLELLKDLKTALYTLTE